MVFVLVPFIVLNNNTYDEVILLKSYFEQHSPHSPLNTAVKRYKNRNTRHKNTGQNAMYFYKHRFAN